MAALALWCGSVAAVLAGTSGLLSATQLAGALPWPGGWVAIPLLPLPLALALAFDWGARAMPADSDGWRLLRQQWQQDLLVLHHAATDLPR